MARRKARELAFRVLFQAERGGSPVRDVWRQVREDLAEDAVDGIEGDGGEASGGLAADIDADALRFVDGLVNAYADHREAVEGELSELVSGWSFGQMAQTDLNVLRLAVTEMRFTRTAPPEVSIEAAVRLAKKFGGEVSGRFVNGVLAKLYRRLAGEGEGVG